MSLSAKCKKIGIIGNVRTRIRWFVVLWLIGILFPVAWFSSLTTETTAWFNQVFGPLWVHIVMHAGLYLVLALCLAWLAGDHWRQRWPLILAAVVLVGVLQEMVQMWGAGRWPGADEVFDLTVDVSGGLIGLGLFALARSRSQIVSDGGQ